jgi:carbon monoxide dehydrogenase subunit G
MQFSNNFEVSLPPAAAWKTLMDIPGIAPCMPGAELTEVVDAETYKGKVAVRMGPVVLAFAGTAKFEERDDANHTARVRAQGADSKGRGAASAVVNFRLEPSGRGSKVLIDTDLNLTGSVAQYGRGAGMIQTIAAQLINQFAKALEKQIAQVAPAAADDGVGDAPAASVARPRPEPATQQVAKPIGGFSLVMKAMWAGLVGLLRGKNESNR